MLNWNRVLLPAMLMQRRGSIVMMSSVSAVKGNVGQTAYAASKAAMSGIARSLALEVGRFGIRVNCTAPGLIRTEMLEEIPAQKLKRCAGRYRCADWAKPTMCCRRWRF